MSGINCLFHILCYTLKTESVVCNEEDSLRNCCFVIKICFISTPSFECIQNNIIKNVFGAVQLEAQAKDLK